MYPLNSQKLISLALIILLTGCQQAKPELPVTTTALSGEMEILPFQANFFSQLRDLTIIGAIGRKLVKLSSDKKSPVTLKRFKDPIKSVHADNNDVIYVATDRDHWNPNTPSNLYRSFDRGETFTLVKTIYGGSVLWWSITSNMEGRVYASEYGPKEPGMSKRIWASNDHGATWEVVFQADNNSNLHIHRIAVDPYTGHLWATTGDSGNRGIYRTKDEGKTWQKMLDSQATSVGFTKSGIYWGEDTKNKPGVTRMDRTTGKTEFVLDLSKLGNYGGSAYDITIDSNQNVIVSFMKYPDQNHVASILTGKEGNWKPLVLVNSEKGKPSGKESLSAPDADGWIYASGIRFRN